MNRISQKDIIRAIQQIQFNPELRKGRASSTYDLIFEGIAYPPKLVISIANKYATGKELNPNDFEGGVGTPSFKLLQKEGFKIITKEQNITEIKDNNEFVELIEKFINQSKTNDLKTSTYNKQFRGLEVKVSFGKGRSARIPWVGLLKEPNTILKGIYPVFLLFKEFNVLVLAYCISETNKPEFKWSNIDFSNTINNWHSREYKKSPYRYGSSYIKGIYNLDFKIDKEMIKQDLNEIVFEYQKLDFETKSESNYWVFQGNPKVYDFETSLKENILTNWTVSAHKDKIKVGDKVIIWITGSQSGCYALAEVTSKPHERRFSPDDHLWEKNNKIDLKVDIKITHNFTDNPISKEDIEDIESLNNLKVGHQGTNFSATNEEYDTMVKLRDQDDNIKYWIYAPGENADYWDEFYNLGIMGLGWDALGDLRSYTSKKKIQEKLQKLAETKSSKKNDSTANFEFVHKIKPKDIIIVKKGRSELLGFGEITSDYYYDNERDRFKSCRKVDWKTKGNWKVNHSLVLKTLTNISDYPSKNDNYEKYYEYLLSIMGANNKPQESLSLNQILYGPPGTGKTYRLQKEYFDQFTINETSLSRDQYIESLVVDLTWWQAISIAVLDLQTAKVNDIYDHKIVRAKEKVSSSKTVKPTIWGQLQYHTLLDCPNVNVVSRAEPLFFNKSEDSLWSIDNDLLEQSFPEAFEILEKSNNFIPSSNKRIKNYEFITFHQSFSYEDFIEGIKPRLDETEKDVSFEIKDGVFKKICLKAQADPNNNYAIFIDEINRGNVSAIFGELITLIEADKRIGTANEIKVKLPYSKSDFGVPSNLSIIGTMNTADRSVEALDTALRRRFSFIEIMPKPSLLSNIKFKEFTLEDVLITINERIEVLLDRDHTIGHSYFIKLESGDIEGLKLVFLNNIIPLLQEYFYHNYEKIALILGEGFVKIKQNNKIKFASFKTIDVPEIDNQFELIYPINDIENAILILLNN
jgi:5-methylcytosine-specific restriction endonuclease McrBC GTP-binding regulatory subunit McrB